MNTVVVPTGGATGAEAGSKEGGATNSCEQSGAGQRGGATTAGQSQGDQRRSGGRKGGDLGDIYHHFPLQELL